MSTKLKQQHSWLLMSCQVCKKNNSFHLKATKIKWVNQQSEKCQWAEFFKVYGWCFTAYLYCRMRQTSQQIISPKLSNSCEWIEYEILVYGVKSSFHSGVDHLHLILFVNVCLFTNSHKYIESNCCLLYGHDTGESTGESTGPSSACSCL